MGVVYKARFVKNDRIVAVKLLPPDASDEKTLIRFQQELEVLRKLRHPHIVHCFGGLCEDNQQFYAMEYVEGGTLADLLRERKTLPWQEVVEFGIQMCSALGCAHDHGIIHRDVKPGNFLITRDGTLKLSDFGLVSVLASRSITAPDRTMGTVRYMAPEQISGQSIGPQTDLYALGCTLYEMLVGQPPFAGPNPAATLRMHLADEIPHPGHIALDCPRDLDTLIVRLLTKTQENRPESAQAVAQALRLVAPEISVVRAKSRKGAGNQPTTGRSAEPAATIAKEPRPEPSLTTFPVRLIQLLVCLIGLLALSTVYLAKSRSDLAPARVKWVTAFQSGTNHDTRHHAADVLSEIGTSDPEIFAVLIEALADQDKRIRTSAARSLGRLGNQDALHALARTEREDPEPSVRNAAREAQEVIKQQPARGSWFWLIPLGIVAATGVATFFVPRLARPQAEDTAGSEPPKPQKPHAQTGK